MRQEIYLDSNFGLSEMLAMRYFAANVRHLRSTESLTKKRLAEVTGLSQGTIGAIENNKNNKNSDMQLSNAITLAAVFRVPFQHLLWTDLSYLPAIKDRFAIKYGEQLGPKFAHSAINDVGAYRKQQLESGAYNRDRNKPSN